MFPQQRHCHNSAITTQGSLEGVGGLKTNEAYHTKADAWLISEMYFFENLPTPFFGNVDFIKFVTFSALLALSVMIWEGYGQIAHQTLPNILLSNASLVTKSCIARFVEDGAFKLGALSDCSKGPSPPHGSLEGVGGLKINEAYHSKADAWLIPEMYFFENLPTPFFGNVGFVKFGTFSALLALPVMIREGYGQIVPI